MSADYLVMASFLAFLKSKLSGQVSFLTSNPGVIRGEHFHNTKLEKFLVIKGKARFRFRSLDNNEKLEMIYFFIFP